MTHYYRSYNQTAPLPILTDRLAGAAVRESREDWQRLCGRWLTWKRVHARFTCQFLAAWIGVEPQTLVLLEKGKADSSILSHLACIHLSQILADDRYTASAIMVVVEAALGLGKFPDQPLREQLRQDLQHKPLPMIG